MTAVLEKAMLFLLLVSALLLSTTPATVRMIRFFFPRCFFSFFSRARFLCS